MRKLAIILLTIITAFSAYAEGLTEVKRIPGKTTPKIYEFSENEQRELENSISILLAPGTLPEGFDDFTFTPEEAREIRVKTNDGKQKLCRQRSQWVIRPLVMG